MKRTTVTGGSVVFSGDMFEANEESKKRNEIGDFEKVLCVKDKETIRSMGTGILLKNPYYPYKMSIMNTSYHYTPKTGDLAIAVVKNRMHDYYVLDINSSHFCLIHKIEGFKYATKSNQPNLSCGSILYVIIEYTEFRNRFVLASCITSLDVKSWLNYENYLGVLFDGFVFKVNIAYAKSLIADKCFILDLIGEDLEYETAIGHNGRIWIKLDDPVDTKLVYDAIRFSYGKTQAEMKEIWDSLKRLRQL